MATKKPPVKKATPRKRKRNKDGKTFEEWANTEQPAPTPRPPDDTERSVQAQLLERLASDAYGADTLIATLDERRRMGREKYGQELFAGNGRDCLVDALQEVQDLLVYLHQAEIEGRDSGVLLADVVSIGMLIERELRNEFDKTAT